LDALVAQVLLDLGQEVLDLFGGEVLDGKGFEEVLGRDEPALPAFRRDGFLGFVQTEIDGRFGHLSPLCAVARDVGQCTSRIGGVTLATTVGVTDARPAPGPAAELPRAWTARRTSARTPAGSLSGSGAPAL